MKDEILAKLRVALAAVCLSGGQLDLQSVELVVFDDIRTGRAHHLRADSKRVSVWVVRMGCCLLKATIDKQEARMLSVVKIKEADLEGCSCGHRHCHEGCRSIRVANFDAKHCRCSKCDCPLCTKLKKITL